MKSAEHRVGNASETGLMTHSETHNAATVQTTTTRRTLPQVLETQLAAEMRLRRFTEEVLDSRQDELEKHEHESKKLTKKLDLLQRELAETQRQLIEARNQAKSKAKQLQDAKDQIFRLQPRRKDITESEAQEAYKKLCGNVQRWVENRLPPAIDDLEAGRVRSKPPAALAVRLVSLIREPARRSLSAHQSDEHHVIAIIMYYLWLSFFAKPFYCRLDNSADDATLAWVDEVESAMSRLPRDAAHCREWRSETLTALTSQADFKTRKMAYIAMVSEDLALLLSAIMPKLPETEGPHSLRKTIVEPAAEFAQRLQLAPNIYSLKWPARNASTRLEVYECLNLASGGLVVDLSATAANSAARRRVSYLFDVAPGLFVERVELGKKAPLKAIYRPNVLVWAGDGQVPQQPTLVKWLCDSVSGSGSSREMLPRTVNARSKTLPSLLDAKL